MRINTMLMGLMAALTAAPAFAQDGLEVIGAPVDGKLGFQPAATELAEQIQWLDGMINVIIIAIVLFVTALLAICIVRYNSKSNPTPAKFTHNTPLEVAWTIVPIMILVFIGAFSLPVLFNQQEIPEGDVTIKVTGYQWYWGYEYIGEDFEYDSYMIGSPATGGDNSYNEEVEAQLIEAGYQPEHFRLATDTAVVVPVNKTIVMQVTAGDVIHSWTIPAFGVKQDGVPGRLAELWFKPTQEGIYFGQCSELCGIAHAYMPITVKVVSEEEYQVWLEEMREEWG
ncbi:MAG: cytochrome c oxidase subunit II [Pseudomonadota bacterium]|uniref:Cytochrome c oxidase subunit 2 n=1 Tax=Thalassococcus halodurans TaxID=373675 RepID=A0A1H5T1L4_9RHOB|nr:MULTISPECIES: cytochrome c oxidase subunit II [Thalassococcus]MEC7667932.1 cytochrome c oxidase subunit II [Pseudomonadota bacterium]MBO6866537.1 cytochrome c oxidase subunit II [Thalassococcus sp.]MEC8579764.1 cytochrome c oxidase subunit II [Pseudomonadota bacterium]MEE3360324.1 cytochrome c oxidase subunit II [Pseudomonadota bacterium]SEF56634.1 cytochrome c oxidase subunit 2 [Thalassococcus halodurans]